MAEYMDYDDTLYDQIDHSKGKKIRSWITVIISAVFLVSVVIFVIVRMPQNVRTKFDTVSSDTHTVGDIANHSENQFYRLYTALQNGDTLKVNDEFIKSYPDVYSMLTLDDKKIRQNTVFGFDEGGVLTAAQTYVVSRAASDESESDVIAVDYLIAPYTSDDSGITVENPVRATLKYYSDKAQNFVTEGLARSDSFRLNFYSISVKIKDGGGENITNETVLVKLADALTKQEADSGSIYDNITLLGGDIDGYSLISGGERGDFTIEKELTAGDISTTADITVQFDDTMYRKFESVHIGAKSGDSFSVYIN